MPSILVETAFISNEQEEKRLADGKYQDATAAGIVNGIKA
jgi:N-acetylmuramoyl-L-alanine amidase